MHSRLAGRPDCCQTAARHDATGDLQSTPSSAKSTHRFGLNPIAFYDHHGPNVGPRPASRAWFLSIRSGLDRGGPCIFLSQKAFPRQSPRTRVSHRLPRAANAVRSLLSTWHPRMTGLPRRLAYAVITLAESDHSLERLAEEVENERACASSVVHPRRRPDSHRRACGGAGTRRRSGARPLEATAEPRREHRGRRVGFGDARNAKHATSIHRIRPQPLSIMRRAMRG